MHSGYTMTIPINTGKSLDFCSVPYNATRRLKNDQKIIILAVCVLPDSYSDSKVMSDARPWSLDQYLVPIP
jgi:hypothetical protein